MVQELHVVTHVKKRTRRARVDPARPETRHPHRHRMQNIRLGKVSLAEHNTVLCHSCSTPCARIVYICLLQKVKAAHPLHAYAKATTRIPPCALSYRHSHNNSTSTIATPIVSGPHHGDRGGRAADSDGRSDLIPHHRSTAGQLAGPHFPRPSSDGGRDQFAHSGTYLHARWPWILPSTSSLAELALLHCCQQSAKRRARR